MAESSNISVTGIGPVKPEQAAPLFLMRDPVIFPYSLTPLLVNEENLAALRQTMERDRLLAIFPGASGVTRSLRPAAPGHVEAVQLP